MRVTVLAGLTAVTLGGLACATTASADSCPNAALRVGPSAGLPDCRAYEQVTPVDKGGYEVGDPDTGLYGNVQALPQGGGVVYAASGGFPGSPTSDATNYYLSTRGASGWSTTSLAPPTLDNDTFISPFTVFAVSPDGSHSIVGSFTALAPGAVSGQQNLYLQDNATDAETLIATNAARFFANPGLSNGQNFIYGGSPDFSTVDFMSSVALTANAPAGQTNLYSWSAAAGVQLINTLPGGGVSGSVALYDALPFPGGTDDRVSQDGSEAVYIDSSTGEVYLVSGGQVTNISGSLGGAKSIGISADGSEVLFISDEPLTPNSTANGSYELYRYDVASGVLTDLTVVPNATPQSDGAEVDGVLGASADGSRVYFDAAASLVNGAPSESGTLNEDVYEWQAAPAGAGTLTYIATVTPVATNAPIGDAQASADGQELAFTTGTTLTPDAVNPGGDLILYEWDSTADGGTGALQCLSCDGGQPATGNVDLGPVSRGQGQQPYVSEPVTSSGQVFFETTESLTAGATNGLENVYEAEDGTTSLISDGSGENNSYLQDVSANGDDVFIVTADQLVGQDDDALNDEYDARVDGGIAAQNPGGAPAPCDAASCRPVPSPPPSPPTAGTSSFTGPGNVTGTRRPSLRASAATRLAGGRLVLTARVPGSGQLTVTGSEVTRSTYRSRHAGAIRIKLTLTRAATARLRERGTLHVALSVRFRATGRTGGVATRRVNVDVHADAKGRS